VFFFGGRAISPTPQWLVGIKALAATYRQGGLELVGVVAADSGAEARQTVRELDITFPVAVAAASDKGGSYGKPHDAFGLQSYGGAFVIDPQGIVHVVNSPGAGADSELLLEPLIQKLMGLPAEEFARRDNQLTIDEWRATVTQWRLLRAGPGSGRVWGRVELPDAQPADYSKSTVTLTPLLRLVTGHTPHGHTVHREDRQTAGATCDAAGNFEFQGLRKGTYVLTITAPGSEMYEQTLAVPTDDAAVQHDVDLTPVAGSSG
jgi:hypothetical protein